MVAPYFQPQRPPWQMQPGQYQQPQYMQWAQPPQPQWQQQAAPVAQPDLWQGVTGPAMPAWQAQAPANPPPTVPVWAQGQLSTGTPQWANSMQTTEKDAVPKTQPQTGQAETTTPQIGSTSQGWTEQPLIGSQTQGWNEQTLTGNGAGTSWSGKTAGFTGSTYAGLQGKFDPWGNWGRYGPNQNGAKKHQTAQGLESDKDRVYRWTNDILRSMGYSGGEDPRAAGIRTQIFLANVERLKSEYAAGKQDWRTSDFYNMDAQLAADGTPVTDPTSTAPGVTNPGGTTPPVTQPGTQPGTPPATGGATPKNFGQLQTDDLASLLQAAANDPDRAAQILRMARGQNGRPLGRMSDFRDSLYGRSFQTALGLAGADGFGNLEGMANDFLSQAQQGNNLIGYGGQLGRKVANMDFTGMDSATMEKFIRSGLAMQGIGMGGLGGAQQQGRLEDIIYSDWARNLKDSSNDTRNFADLLNGSAFQRAMQAYGR